MSINKNNILYFHNSVLYKQKNVSENVKYYTRRCITSLIFIIIQQTHIHCNIYPLYNIK